jgi:hypothetical protein
MQARRRIRPGARWSNLVQAGEDESNSKGELEEKAEDFLRSLPRRKQS